MKKTNILVVDDDKIFRDLLTDVLQFEGYSVIAAERGKGALKSLQDHHVDLVLLDLVLPDMDGIEVLQNALSKQPGLVVVMISGQGTIQRAVEATRLGAYDFLEKPLDAERILLTVRNALETSVLRKQSTVSIAKSYEKYGMIGESPAIHKIFTLIDVLAPTNTSILISGESGTGKELFARALHNNSNRSEAPFIRVNCAAIPDTLIESELFGHEKGAFTGARTAKKGLFQLAHTGTIFLDEVGDLSLSAQAKILRVLDEGELLRVGSERYEKVDVRTISATNKNIEKMVANGEFREDLYYRIDVVPVEMPPLRERPGDIISLARHYLAEACRDNNLPDRTLLPDAGAVLTSQLWRGNVRELKNFIEKLAILVEPARITGRVVHTLLHSGYIEMTTDKTSLRQAREAFERSFILDTLRHHNWNISSAAEALGIERSNLYRKMEKLGIKAE